MAKIQNTDTKYWWLCGATGTLHSLLVGMQSGAATLEDLCVVYYKTKHTLTIWYNNHAPWYLPKWAKNLRSHKKLHMNIDRSCMHCCQKLEATKMSE